MCPKSHTGRLFNAAELVRAVRRDDAWDQNQQIGQRNPASTAQRARAVRGHPTHDQLARISGIPTPNRTEIEKKHHHYTVFGSLFTFSHKIRGTNPNTRYTTKKTD